MRVALVVLAVVAIAGIEWVCIVLAGCIPAEKTAAGKQATLVVRYADGTTETFQDARGLDGLPYGTYPEDRGRVFVDDMGHEHVLGRDVSYEWFIEDHAEAPEKIRGFINRRPAVRGDQ